MPPSKAWKLMQLIGGISFLIGFSGCVGYTLQGKAPDQLTLQVMEWATSVGAVLWAIGKTGRWWLRE